MMDVHGISAETLEIIALILYLALSLSVLSAGYSTVWLIKMMRRPPGFIISPLVLQYGLIKT